MALYALVKGGVMARGGRPTIPPSAAGGLRGFGPKWTKLSKAVAYDRSTLEDFARSNLRSSTSEIVPERTAASPPPRRRGRHQKTSTAPEGV
jgi:hypothetical protein